MTHAERLIICHKCEHRYRPCRGPCPCLIDGKDIIEHAQTDECPKGKYTEPVQIGVVAKVAHGAAGIAKAVTGTGGASDELVKERTAICTTCDEGEIVAGVFHRCKICKCATWAKVRNKDEHCPLTPPKW